MILKYGNYAHDNDEIWPNITRQALVSETGQHYATRETWRLSGFLQAGTQPDITTKANAIRDAYKTDGHDITYFLDNGTTPTHLRILNSQTLGGVRVVQEPSFPFRAQGEYSTYHYYEIVVEADIALTNANVILKWEESLEMIGAGGPTIIYLPLLIGPWQAQMTTQQSSFQVIQSGSAIGLSGYPIPAAPIWPAAELTTRRRLRKRTPRFRYPLGQSGTTQEFPISWSYTFEGNATLAGIPTPL